MRKSFLLAASVVVLAAMLVMNVSAYSANKMSDYGQETVNVYKAATAPVLDGVVNAGEYNTALRVLNNGDEAVYFNGDAELFTSAELDQILPDDFTIYAAYDDTYLYIASTNVDSSHCTPLTGTGIWDGDYLEFDLGTNVSADFAGMTDKLRLAMGASSADGSNCVYAALQQSDAATAIELNVNLDGIGIISHDDATGLTTYEACIPWSYLTSNGQAPASAFFYYQLGIGDANFLDKSEYEAYLGVFRYGTLIDDEQLKTEAGTSVIANLMVFAGDAPVAETAAPETEAAAADTAADTAASAEAETSTPAAQTADILAVCAAVMVASAAVIVIKKRK